MLERANAPRRPKTAAAEGAAAAPDVAPPQHPLPSGELLRSVPAAAGQGTAAHACEEVWVPHGTGVSAPRSGSALPALVLLPPAAGVRLLSDCSRRAELEQAGERCAPPAHIYLLCQPVQGTRASQSGAGGVPERAMCGGGTNLEGDPKPASLDSVRREPAVQARAVQLL